MVEKTVFNASPAREIPERNCAKCRFHEKTALPSSPANASMICRKNPGTPVILMQQTPNGVQSVIVAAWLPVTEYDWCDNFIRRHDA